jgi:hypothetical protein
VPFRRLWPSILAVALSACVSVQETQTAVESAWVGRQADEFFIAYGPPSSDYRLDNGDRLVRWSSGVNQYFVPGSSHSTGTVIGNQVSVTTYSSPPSAIETECQVDIVIDPKGTITKMRIAKDTVGDWQLSRCREFLKVRVKN